jgi:hypothetical protein
MTFAEALTAMVTVLSAADLERSGVTYEVRLGDEFLEANGAPPRIVIVPLSAQPAPARMQQAPNPRSIAGESHLFVAELWGKGAKTDTAKGKDYAAVSIMKATFTQAMRATFGTTFQLQEGQWSAVAGESINQDGRRYSQRFTLSVLSLDIANPVIEVLESNTNTGVSNPGDNFVDVST